MMIMKMNYKVFTFNTNRVMKRLFLATISVVLLLAGCYKDDILQMHKEIESLRDAKVASLSEQAEGIKASIADLNGVGSSLQEFIAALESSEASTGQELSALEEKIAAFEQSAGAGIDAMVEEFLEKVKGLETALQAELGTIGSVVSTLETDSDAIDSAIETLKSYLDGKFAEKDSFEGTYATLEIQDAVIEDIENIKFHIKALNASAEELNEMLKGLVSDSVDKFSKTFSGSVLDNANAILDACNAALSDMESTLAQSESEAILKAVEGCETSVMAWINESLDDYYTVAAAEAQIEACNLLLGNVPESKSLQSEIDDAVASLESAKSSVNEVYAKAIEDAIKDHNSRISAKFSEQILDLRENVIAPVTSRVEVVRTQVSGIWNAMGDLEDRILTAEGQRQAISSSLSILNELDMTLKEYIESVRTELLEADSSNYDTIKGLIDGLDAVINGTDDDSFASQIAAIKAYLGTIPEDDTVKDVASWISSTLAALDLQFSTVSKISEVDEIVDALMELLGNQETGIEELENNLEDLISSSEDTIKGWVDTKMKATGYYDAGELEGLLEAFEFELSAYFSDGDEELQKKIDAVSDELDRQKEALESAYAKAIEEAIGTEEGKVTTEIENRFKPSNDQLATLKNRSGLLKAEVDGLRSELDGYLDSVDTIEQTLITLKAFLSANGYTSLLAIVTKIESDLASASTTYASAAELSALSEYVNGALKTEVEKIAGLVSRLDTVEGQLATIGSFLNGFDASNLTLKQQVTAIQNYLAALKAAVNGPEGGQSLQTQIDAINVALYGKAMDAANPSEDSIMGMLKKAAALLIPQQISSITYVPSYLDQKEVLYYQGNGVYFAKFRFIVRPAGIASLVASNPEMFTMKFKTYDSNTYYEFDTQTINADADGIITVVVSESSHTELLKQGICASLFFEYVDEDTELVASSFTSEFIPVVLPTTSGTGFIPVEPGDHLFFPAEGGEITITVGDENTPPFWLVHDQGEIFKRLDLLNILYEITSYYYEIVGNLFPPSWIHVSPEEPNAPNLSVIWRAYYVGKNELTIKVDPNPSTEPRDGRLVFRIIDTDWSLDRDLIIYVHQDGRTN